MALRYCENLGTESNIALRYCENLATKSNMTLRYCENLEGESNLHSRQQRMTYTVFRKISLCDLKWGEI
jgi:hypothetical protein